jgi:hypothetical protein
MRCAHCLRLYCKPTTCQTQEPVSKDAPPSAPSAVQTRSLASARRARAERQLGEPVRHAAEIGRAQRIELLQRQERVKVVGRLAHPRRDRTFTRHERERVHRAVGPRRGWPPSSAIARSRRSMSSLRQHSGVKPAMSRGALRLLRLMLLLIFRQTRRGPRQAEPRESVGIVLLENLRAARTAHGEARNRPSPATPSSRTPRPAGRSRSGSFPDSRIGCAYC